VRPNKKNPAYKGKWRAPKIPNPAYIGPWAPRKIPNPNFFVDEHPSQLPAIVRGISLNLGTGRCACVTWIDVVCVQAAVAIEIWTMSGGIMFDNILVSHDEHRALEFGAQVWHFWEFARTEQG
jgi:calnexin